MTGLVSNLKRMAEIIPIRAHRYDLGHIGALSEVLSLPGDRPDGPFHAARLPESLPDFLREDVLVQDSARSFYLVEQARDGLSRWGFLARIGAHTGNITPHIVILEEVELAVADLRVSVGRRPALEAIDRSGTCHRLWVVSDQHTLSAVCGLLGPVPMFVQGWTFLTDLEWTEVNVPAGLAFDLGS